MFIHVLRLKIITKQTLNNKKSRFFCAFVPEEIVRIDKFYTLEHSNLY